MRALRVLRGWYWEVRWINAWINWRWRAIGSMEWDEEVIALNDIQRALHQCMVDAA